MIKRLLIITVLLITMLFSAGVIARAIGQSAPNPIRRVGFEICDGKPCMAGITPTVTRWDDALKSLVAQGVKYEMDVNDSFRRDEVGFTFRPADDIAFWIRITRPIGSPTVQTLSVFNGEGKDFLPLQATTLGDVLLLYGLPCGISVGNDNVLPLGVANVHLKRFSRQRISVDHALYNVQLGSRTFNSDCMRAIEWRGFAEGEFYNALINRYYHSRAR